MEYNTSNCFFTTWTKAREVTTHETLMMWTAVFWFGNIIHKKVILTSDISTELNIKTVSDVKQVPHSLRVKIYRNTSLNSKDVNNLPGPINTL